MVDILAAAVHRADGKNMNSYGMYIIGLALVLIFAGIFFAIKMKKKASVSCDSVFPRTSEDIKKSWIERALFAVLMILSCFIFGWLFVFAIVIMTQHLLYGTFLLLFFVAFSIICVYDKTISAWCKNKYFPISTLIGKGAGITVEEKTIKTDKKSRSNDGAIAFAMIVSITLASLFPNLSASFSIEVKISAWIFVFLLILLSPFWEKRATKRKEALEGQWQYFSISTLATGMLYVTDGMNVLNIFSILFCLISVVSIYKKGKAVSVEAFSIFFPYVILLMYDIHLTFGMSSYSYLEALAISQVILYITLYLCAILDTSSYKLKKLENKRELLETEKNKDLKKINVEIQLLKQQIKKRQYVLLSPFSPFVVLFLLIVLCGFLGPVASVFGGLLCLIGVLTFYLIKCILIFKGLGGIIGCAFSIFSWIIAGIRSSKKRKI